MRCPSVLIAFLLVAAGSTIAAPVAAAEQVAPVIISADGTISPPSDVFGSTCDQTSTDCGLFALDVTFGSIGALPLGQFSAQLFGQARSTRVFGCVSADGVRLPDHETTVVSEGDQLASRRGLPVSVDPGDVTARAQVFDFFEHGIAPACPENTYRALYSMLIDQVSLGLTTFGDPQVTFDYTVPGSWSWTGTVPDFSSTPQPLLTKGTVALFVQPPEQSGRSADCPLVAQARADVNGCGRLVTDVDVSRPTGSSALHGAVRVDGRLIRSYGCVTSGGRRLHRYDTRVVQPTTFNGGPGKVFWLSDGTARATIELTSVLDDGQPGNCPHRSHAVLYRIAVRRLTVTVVAFVDPEQRRTIAVPNRTQWSGRIATG